MGRPDFHSFPPTGRFPLARVTGLPCPTPGIGHPASTRRAPPGGKSQGQGCPSFLLEKIPKNYSEFFPVFYLCFYPVFFSKIFAVLRKILTGLYPLIIPRLFPGLFPELFSILFLELFP